MLVFVAAGCGDAMMHGLKQLSVAFLLSLICCPCAVAQEQVSVTGPGRSGFPQNGYRPLPPHFQPRRLIAADPEKVSVAPPSLPSYDQPLIPADGYLWVPGFWAWRKSVPDYFWVPGTWVRPPQSGLLWTPPYWSRAGDAYSFHPGYWAKEVGFYGGIEYGFGYTGKSYRGGRWSKDAFYYDRACNNLGSIEIANGYGDASASAGNSSCVSDDADRAVARPSRDGSELTDTRRIEATPEQRRHFELAAMDRSLYSKLNGGAPAVAATPHAGVLTGDGITASRRHSDQTATRDGNTIATPVSSAGMQPAAK